MALGIAWLVTAEGAFILFTLTRIPCSTSENLTPAPRLASNEGGYVPYRESYRKL
jgi:hypothetical protein